MRSALFERRGCVLRTSMAAALVAMTLPGCTSVSPPVSSSVSSSFAAKQSIFAVPPPFRPTTPEPAVTARLANAKTALAVLASNRPDDVVRGRAYLTRALSVEQLKAALPKFELDSVAYLHTAAGSVAAYYRQDRNNTVDEAMAGFVRAHENFIKGNFSAADALKTRAKNPAQPGSRAAENALRSAKAMQADYEKNGLQIYAIEFCARPAELIKLRDTHRNYIRGIEPVRLNRLKTNIHCR